VRQNGRIHVTVRANQRQVTGFLVQPVCHAPDFWVGVEKPVIVQNQRSMHPRLTVPESVGREARSDAASLNLRTMSGDRERAPTPSRRPRRSCGNGWELREFRGATGLVAAPLFAAPQVA